MLSINGPRRPRPRSSAPVSPRCRILSQLDSPAPPILPQRRSPANHCRRELSRSFDEYVRGAFRMATIFMRLCRSVTAFIDDTRGVILPYVTVLMAVFVGLGALALDGGRYMSTQTQMQAI